MTAMGIILGTAAYMSPEQARGRAADKRTDIWAFGCVLFEMLAARRPFEGEDVTEVLAAIVNSKPVWELLPATVPAPLVNLLTRCLEKDIRLRLRDIGDVRFDLSEALAPSVNRVTPSSASGHVRLVWLAAAIIVCVLTTIAWWPRSAPIAIATPTRFSFVVPEGQRPPGGLRHLAISPDGSVIVFATSSRLYRRALNQMEPEPIAGTEGATLPMFSPDGRSIAYLGLTGARRNFALKTVPVGGGSPVKLADLGEVSNRAGWTPLDSSMAWNGDDIVISSPAGVSAVSATSGTQRVLVSLDPAVEVGTAPQLLDNGRRVLFTVRRVNETGPEASSIVVQTVGSADRRMLVRAAKAGVALTTGHLVYLRGTDLMAAAFDTRRLEVTGDPRVIATGVTVQSAVSDAGTIAYQADFPAATPRMPVWVDRHGNEEAIPMPPQVASLLRLSPDGRRLALTGDTEIRVWSFEKRTITRMAEPGGGHWDAVWRTDGRRLLFSNGASQTVVRILEKTIDDAATATVLTEAPDGGYPNAISPDDRFLIFHRGAGELMLQALDPPAPARPLVTGVALNAVFSPDGRWIAYQSEEAGRAEIVVRAFRDTAARRWQVSSNGGRYPLWSPDGRELLFINGAGVLTSVAVDSRNGFATGTPVELFQTRAYIPGTYS
jgi:serine/threonine-protein kinase